MKIGDLFNIATADLCRITFCKLFNMLCDIEFLSSAEHEVERRRGAELARDIISPCTACGFWDTGLNPTQRRQQFEAASGGIGLA